MCEIGLRCICTYNFGTEQPVPQSVTTGLHRGSRAWFLAAHCNAHEFRNLCGVNSGGRVDRGPSPRLAVTVDELDEWKSEEDEPPAAVFLRGAPPRGVGGVRGETKINAQVGEANLEHAAGPR